MNGHDHWREAERLDTAAAALMDAAQADRNADWHHTRAAILTARAQVHATLALAGVQVDNLGTAQSERDKDRDDWIEMMGDIP